LDVRQKWDLIPDVWRGFGVDEPDLVELPEKIGRTRFPDYEDTESNNGLPLFQKLDVMLYSMDCNAAVTASYKTDGRTGLVSIVVTPNSRRR
jgi:hypothetical protein